MNKLKRRYKNVGAQYLGNQKHFYSGTNRINQQKFVSSKQIIHFKNYRWVGCDWFNKS